MAWAAQSALRAAWPISALLAAMPAAASPATLAPWSGGQPPAFMLDDLTGTAQRLDTFRGQVVLVHFFATWCEPCIFEMASLQRLAQASRDRPLAIVAVNVGELDLRVRAFFEKRPVEFPVLLDRDRATAKAWGISALPATVVLDVSLHPRLSVDGDLDWTRPDVLSAIAALYPDTIHDETAGHPPANATHHGR
jgi:thiol-disulfide isomerase/thioredoxin